MQEYLPFGVAPASHLPDWPRGPGQVAAGRAVAASPASRREELKHAAQEFESLFVSYLLKVMRETIEEADGGSFSGKSIYTDMFDQELSRVLSRQGALGISDLVMKRVDENAGASAPLAPAPGKDSSDSALDPVPDFRMPLPGPVTSAFGMRKDPFTGDMKFHKGIDLAAPEGTPVKAPRQGTVVFAGFRPGYGNLVVLRHEDGTESRYGHLGELLVRAGDVVGREGDLGRVGQTGRATGPHLHFELVRAGRPVDPATEVAAE